MCPAAGNQPRAGVIVTKEATVKISAVLWLGPVVFIPDTRIKPDRP